MVWFGSFRSASHEKDGYSKPELDDINEWVDCTECNHIKQLAYIYVNVLNKTKL